MTLAVQAGTCSHPAMKRPEPAPEQKRPKPVPMDKKHQDELLDEALKATFPASDPFSVQSADRVEMKRE